MVPPSATGELSWHFVLNVHGGAITLRIPGACPVPTPTPTPTPTPLVLAAAVHGRHLDGVRSRGVSGGPRGLPPEAVLTTVVSVAVVTAPIEVRASVGVVGPVVAPTVVAAVTAPCLRAIASSVKVPAGGHCCLLIGRCC